MPDGRDHEAVGAGWAALDREIGSGAAARQLVGRHAEADVLAGHREDCAAVATDGNASAAPQLARRAASSLPPWRKNAP